MREIKFRGHRWDTGWLYGDLSHSFIGTKICVRDETSPYDGFEVVVNPETVGQFTGKRDKTTVTEIYEGDILYSSRVNEYFVVEWDNENARFILRNGSATADWLSHNEYEFDYEVVGNIYDNPELVQRSERMTHEVKILPQKDAIYEWEDGE